MFCVFMCSCVLGYVCFLSYVCVLKTLLVICYAFHVAIILIVLCAWGVFVSCVLKAVFVRYNFNFLRVEYVHVLS